MNDETFEVLERRLQKDGPDAGFEFLLQRFREDKKYPSIFEARLMKKRLELGLPLIQDGTPSGLSPEKEEAYHKASLDAAREVGKLFLQDGEIEQAWAYFRAIGEPAPVASAIEKVDSNGDIDRIVEIAFYEAANPSKGFELILSKYGICRAITSYGHYPQAEGREESARLLIRTLYRELAGNLKRTIREQEGQAPETDSISDLIPGRDWLFEGNRYYIDTSHVTSVMQIGRDLEDRETLGMILELSEYGRRLAPMFQYKGEPPFENIFQDHRIYLRALLGQDAEAAIAHFRAKLAPPDGEGLPDPAAQALVKLLVRLQRYSEAIGVSAEYLANADPEQLNCPSTLQLCQLAGDFKQLGSQARRKDDLLSYIAALLQTG